MEQVFEFPLVIVEDKGVPNGVASLDEEGKIPVKQLPDNIEVKKMTGATENQNGSAGMVPAPQAGDENKVLTGSGLWGELPKHVMYETKADVEQAFVNGELKNGDVWMTKEKNVAPTPTPTPTPDPEPEPEEPDIPDPETSEINDIQTWLKCAEITDKSYTTLAEVIADSGILLTLMSNLDAMTYLARSTGFMEEGCSNATFMQYLGNSPHVDDTVLNSDIWVTAISSSNYYELVYKPITVHSSASATISFNGKSFTSDASGNTTKVIPWGTFTFSDSISGQSYERTIDKDTTDLYVMPEGSLYWYGNECEWVTGGYVINDTMSSNRPLNGNVIKETNSVYLNTYYSDASFRTNNKIDFSKYSTIYATITDIVEDTYVKILSTYSSSTVTKEEAIISTAAAGTFSEDVSTLTDYFYVVACCGGYRSGRFHAFWLE